eukprot:216430_1
METSSIQPVRPPLSQQPPQRIDVDNRSSEQSQQQQQPTKTELSLTNPMSNNSTSNNVSSDRNNQQQHQQQNDTNIPDVDMSRAYKRRSLKHHIHCGYAVKIGSTEINELKTILGLKKCAMYSNNDCMSLCVVCDDKCVDGEFAVETILFIPNKNDPA